ncbi:hypothetical protein [Celeribacter indicus]|uniref:DUF2029 domain-containing protein n=1 Tax=Celeribacter indicus TaxID=1208324 RepID=A0A0B5DXS8_9RHOB|nr:hypothetical protein [Celeribacter indicus]AJE45920.1 hypothetical protein P73_1205 [Celeribacter indicus]SDW63793.1 hypothetical protein SAMN05443573_105153 [Celeribacter indicus]
MSRISPGRYAVFLAVSILVFGAAGLAKGGLYIGRHEGDTAHMIEIVLRMLDGQVPHLDFSTPIGIFAFLPVVAVAKAGLGLGQAFVAGQIVVAVLLAPAIWRVGISRLTGIAAWGYGLVSVAMILALVHGEDVAALSVSMYYNRWAWAAAFAAILLSLLPADPRREAPGLDGVFTGALLAVLALVKPTFFVAFVLPVALGFILRGAWRSLAAGIVTGLVIAAAMVALYGVDFFPAYIADLLSVTRSETRAAPGVPFMEILNGPRFLIGTVALLLSVIVLRQSGQGRSGLLLLLFAPGFLYVTYQNFGNDPKWLMLLAVLLLAHRPPRGMRVLFNADARNASAALALVAFALVAPSFQNIVTSPFRHLAEDTEGYGLQFPERAETYDIFVRVQRTQMVLAREALVDRYAQLAPYVTEDALFEPVTFLGERLPRCTLDSGDGAMHRYMADRLKEVPFNYPPEAQFFVADIASAIWILGDFAPLEGGAPWYYSGAPGVGHADAIIVPTCPIAPEVQRNALAAIEAAGLTLRPPLRDEMMLVYPVVK